MTTKPLIYDIGAHTGEDTDFYLKKGFAVVAVEAAPDHVEKLRILFRDQLLSGDLIIEPVAIGIETKRGSFLVHSKISEWNRENFDPRHPSAHAGEFEKLDVNFVHPSAIFEKYQVPHYLKIDIEGNDWIVVKSISKNFSPEFISFEECEEYRELLFHLKDCGYQSFQIVDQSKYMWIRQKKPSLEGDYVKMKFKRGMTGPFGMDLADRWMDLGSMLRLIAKLAYDKGEWYDFHASLFPSRFGRLIPP